MKGKAPPPDANCSQFPPVSQSGPTLGLRALHKIPAAAFAAPRFGQAPSFRLLEKHLRKKGAPDVNAVAAMADFPYQRSPAAWPEERSQSHPDRPSPRSASPCLIGAALYGAVRRGLWERGANHSPVSDSASSINSSGCRSKIFPKLSRNSDSDVSSRSKCMSNFVAVRLG